MLVLDADEGYSLIISKRWFIPPIAPRIRRRLTLTYSN